MSAEEVRQASDRFYMALNRMVNGDVSAMFDACSHADDVSAMHPLGGRQLGWPEVRASWQMAADALGTSGSVEASDLQITLLGSDGAFTTGTETASATVGGNPIAFSGRCTNVYRREDGVWKMVHHQVDLLPDVAAAFQAAVGQAG